MKGKVSVSMEFEGDDEYSFKVHVDNDNVTLSIKRAGDPWQTLTLNMKETRMLMRFLNNNINLED